MTFLRTVRAWLAPVLVLSLVGAAVAARLNYPPTRTDSIVDTYFGKQVADPYQWLEQDDSPQVKAWGGAQTALAKSYIESRPSYAFYSKRVAELSKTSTARF